MVCRYTPPVPLVYRFVRRLLRLALAFFYAEVEVDGADRVPREGAVLLAANHHISMIDPFLLVATAPRAVRFVAMAPLFRVPILGFFLRRLDCIPAHRRQDAGYAKEKNEALFEAVGSALAGGGAVGIFPEGVSHDDPALAPFRHGAAKMALDAESRSGFRLGLKVVPVGIHIEESRLFRGRVLVTYGAPFTLEAWRDRVGADSREAVAGVTAALQERISSLILEADSAETVRLAGIVEGLTHQDESGSLKEALARKQFLLGEFARVRRERPLAAAAMLTAARRYERVHRSPRGSVVASLLLLVLGAPFLLAGVVANGVPYLLSRVVGWASTKLQKRGQDVRAGNGFLAALLCFPAWYAAASVGLAAVSGPAAWIPFAVGGPLCGILALASLERWRRLPETLSGPDPARLARLRRLVLRRLDSLR